ncbi:MAG: hypothetical protein HC913_00020 [Microscillaceae bacterium]|nr:hypothetical protein [Microscillaceae bacterium]
MKLFGRIVVLCLLGVLYAFLSYAQDSSRVAGRYTQAPGRDDGKVLFFKHINEYRYYKDDDKLAELDRLAKKGNLQETYDALYSYVMRFGPENFHKDNYLLWRLGKLAEQLGYLDKAKAFYQLVLKHHRYGNVKDYRLYYDSVSRNDLDYYLPVEYYYNLSNAAGNIDTLRVPESIYTALGDSVNAKYYNDYGPALSGNDRILLFTSQRKQRLEGLRHVPDEGLYYARRADSLYIRETEEGSQMDTLPWTRAQPFIGLNTEKYNEGSPCISKDGRTIFLPDVVAPTGLEIVICITPAAKTMVPGPKAETWG